MTIKFLQPGTCTSPCDAVQASIVAAQDDASGSAAVLSRGEQVGRQNACNGALAPTGSDSSSGTQVCTYTPQQDAGICLPNDAYYNTKLCNGETGRGISQTKYAYYEQDGLLRYGTCGNSKSFKAVPPLKQDHSFHGKILKLRVMVKRVLMVMIAIILIILLVV